MGGSKGLCDTAEVAARIVCVVMGDLVPGLGWLNGLRREEAERELMGCCASPVWAAAMAGGRPYPDLDALLEAADLAWWAVPPDEWERAFAAHPRIGERSGGWSASEQAGVGGAAAGLLEQLEEGNREYEARFGRVFLIRASGRDAGEMLDELRERLENDPAVELRVAAEQQRQITRLRLERLLREHA
jgi:OHCU decarboxylase